jgi:hypothetical protein
VKLVRSKNPEIRKRRSGRKSKSVFNTILLQRIDHVVESLVVVVVEAVEIQLREQKMLEGLIWMTNVLHHGLKARRARMLPKLSTSLDEPKVSHSSLIGIQRRILNGPCDPSILKSLDI